jgi:adenosine deaminase
MERIRALPKAELHVHLEGTLEPELIFALAERHGVAPPADDVEALRARYAFRNLASFLELYYGNMAVLRRAEDFAAMTTAYLERAALAGVRHAEVFFDPQAHTSRGVALGEVLEGVHAGLEAGAASTGISTGLIACFLRNHPVAEAMTTLEGLLAHGGPLLGVGLDSVEVDYPPGPFAPVFARAAAAGLVLVAHAGEEGPPAYVTGALDELGVTRIDHGVASMEDPALVARLAAGRVPLTVCPLSNVRLGVVAGMAGHPLPAMLAAGLLVTVNSDDPSYFGGYVDDNYAALVDGLDLDEATLAVLARNSFAAAVVDPARRAGLCAEVDAWEAAGA